MSKQSNKKQESGNW